MPPFRALAATLALVGASVGGDPARAVTIDMVFVGNPNNPAHYSGDGSVAEPYRIGKYEVTIGQYTDFLNAVDPGGHNPYGVYDAYMTAESWNRGISYNDAAPSGEKYSPMGTLNRPVAFISWFDAARFANWMHNGQGSGSTETGAYTLGGATSGWAPAVNPGAQYFIPTTNQWYKAAFYSPVLNSGSGGYYSYATQSNTAPGNVVGDAPNQANYYNGVFSVTQSATYTDTNLLTEVGSFTKSASYYGTFDQSGNVWEWTDGTGTAGQYRGLAGGAYYYSNVGNTVWSGVPPSGDGYIPFRMGFRLAGPAVPTVYSATTASSGEIDATAGLAQVGTLAGATLNTGEAGATVTTLSSGTINTSGGTVTTEGGTFTGSITGSGGLTMDGDGTLRLETANTYGGGTFITSGTVEIARGDAIGSAPIRIANNGKFRAIAGVAVTNPVVATSPAAIYEHVLGESDPITNLAPLGNGIATVDIAAGNSPDTATTVTSNFNANGSVSLSGLNGTKFLMVLNLDGYIPEDATPETYYLGWWNETANNGAGGWVNAVVGNIGEPGNLAGSYTVGYQAFLDANGGWDGTAMLGAYGLDLPNQQVWAVIDHNSDFGVTNNGILVVPEPGSLALTGLCLAGIAAGWRHRRLRTLAACLGLGLVAAIVPEAASAQDPIEVTGGTAATIPGTYASGTYPSVLVSGTSSTLTVNEPLVIEDTEFLYDVLTIESNGRFVANANVTVTAPLVYDVEAAVGSGGVLELQSGIFTVNGGLRLSGVGSLQRGASGSYRVQGLSLSDGATAAFRTGDELIDTGTGFYGTSVSIDTGASLTLEQNLAADYLSLLGAGATLARTAQTLTVTELTVAEGASLDLIAGDVVDGISVGNYDPGQTGSSTVNLAPGATALSMSGLGLLSNGSIPQLATIPYEVDALSLGGQSLTYRSGSGIEDTIRNFVDVGDNATLTLEKDLTLTGEGGGLLLASGGAINRNGFSVSAPSLYLQDGGSFTLDATATVTDSVSVTVFDAAETATLTLDENLVLTGETAPFGRGLSLSGAGAMLVRGEGITITATAADTELSVYNSADFTVRAGDDFTGARLVAQSGSRLTIGSAQQVATASVEFTDFETSAPATLTINAPLTITSTDSGALTVDGGGQLDVNADVAVGDVVVSSFSDPSVLSLAAGTFTAGTMTVTSSSVTRSGGVYDIGTLTLQGSSMTFQAGDSLAGLALEDAGFPTTTAAAFSTSTALALDSLSILGTSALTLGSFDGSDAFVSDYGLRLTGDQATNLTSLVTAGRIIAPNFGELTIVYDPAAGATYVSTVPEPAGLSLAALGLAAAAGLRRRAGSRRAASADRA